MTNPIELARHTFILNRTKATRPREERVAGRGAGVEGSGEDDAGQGEGC